MLVIFCGVVVALHCSSADSGPNGASAQCNASSTALYHDRIEPLLTDSNPKTCNQCHLSGVDLASFARSTPCETMACFVDKGLVDLASPEDSKVLTWIDRAKPDSALITEAVIQAEHDGFLQWIQSVADCPSSCSGATCGMPSTAASCKIDPEPATAVQAPRDFECGDAALEQLFLDDVFAFRGRCFPCHYSSETQADAEAPRWIRDEGNCATSSIETLHQVVTLGLMDLENPTQSLLLRKPLDEIAGGVKHGGGNKFEDMSDPAYQSFLDFIQRYADCQKQ
jgi:hypothetical protein